MAVKKLSFEQSLSRLDEIVRHLEKGDLPLSESLALYEEGTGLIKQCRISRMDYSEYLKSASSKGEKFDLVFLDPPFAKDVKDEVLKKVSKADILNPGAIVVCESDVDRFTENESVYGLSFRRKYRYGRVYITMLEKTDDNVENQDTVTD